MCKYTNASYRQGAIVSAVQLGQSGEIRTSVSQAWMIGERIVEAESAYREQILSAISRVFNESDGPTLSQPYFASDDRIKSRFAPGLIIDFPRVEIGLDLGKISLRTCLTVCSNGIRSKIWTRVVTHFFEGAEISIDWLTEFHELAGALSKGINENIRNLYREDFGTAIERKIELKTHGRLHVLAVDCEGSGIGAVIRETADDLAWGEDEIDCIEDLELSAALKDVTGSAILPEAVRDAEPDTPTFELCHERGAHLFPFSARNGARGMFVSHSTEEDAYLVGLVSPGQSTAPEHTSRVADTTPEEPQLAYPPSSGTTAEIATFIGKKY